MAHNRSRDDSQKLLEWLITDFSWSNFLDFLLLFSAIVETGNNLHHLVSAVASYDETIFSAVFTQILSFSRKHGTNLSCFVQYGAAVCEVQPLSFFAEFLSTAVVRNCILSTRHCEVQIFYLWTKLFFIRWCDEIKILMHNFSINLFEFTLWDSKRSVFWVEIL